jgi:hypothetical protein
MLLTISTTHVPATDLGFLLHKNPESVQSRELGVGIAHVLYPEASAERCTPALVLDVDPVALIRGPVASSSGVDEYVNDRPYVASSGVGALERFVRRDPLRDVHECVFAVLALESEPVDPRL